MFEATRVKCLAAVDELLEHPIAEIFAIPVDPVRDNVPNYFDVVKKPSDLSTVKKKLTENQYKSVKEFKIDVNQIWENAVLFNGRPSLHVYMADELKRIFTKKMKQIEEPSSEIWMADYAKSQANMYKLFRAQPKQLEQFNLSPDTEMLVPERRISRSMLQDEDKKLFQEVFRYIDDPKVIADLKQIIAENEPSVDITEEELHINLSALSQKTLKQLKVFALKLKDKFY